MSQPLSVRELRWGLGFVWDTFRKLPFQTVLLKVEDFAPCHLQLGSLGLGVCVERITLVRCALACANVCLGPNVP